MLSIYTKIDDFRWPWPAITSNSLGISQDLTDLGANMATTAKRMKIDTYSVSDEVVAY